jgi:hypothetical protein
LILQSAVWMEIANQHVDVDRLCAVGSGFKVGNIPNVSNGAQLSLTYFCIFQFHALEIAM